MIIQRWADFRGAFAERVEHVATGGDSVQFTAPSTLTRSGAGDWTADGFEVGMRVQPIGSSSNDRYYTAATVGTATMTVTEVNVVTEGPVTSGLTVEAVHVDPDAIERWPVANVRAGSFGAMTGWTVPYATTLMTLTVNGGGSDAVYGVDEYDWYVSQRTDDPVLQYLTLDTPDAFPLSYSGTLTMVHSALAESEFEIEIGTALTPSQLVLLFKHVSVYVQRRSDKAIQWSSALRVQVANT